MVSILRVRRQFTNSNCLKLLNIILDLLSHNNPLTKDICKPTAIAYKNYKGIRYSAMAVKLFTIIKYYTLVSIYIIKPISFYLSLAMRCEETRFAITFCYY